MPSLTTVPHDPLTPAYSPARIILHWVSAAVVLWASFSGFIAGARPLGDPVRTAIGTLNPQLTTVFIPFFLWRAGLYLYNRPWRGWSSLRWEPRLAVVGHGMLYACIAAVLVTGFLMMPHAWYLLGVLPMPRPVSDRVILEAVGNLHRSLCVILALLIGIHLLAVLKHHMTGNPVLNRMRLSAAGSIKRA